MYLLIVFATFALSNSVLADRPCAVRTTPKESVVCVCNATYCDEIRREIPTKDDVIIYTSSKSGFRFTKSYGKLQALDLLDSSRFLEIDPTTKYQTIEGFGGAVTDAASMNWKSVSDNLQDKLINSYFSEDGLQYNMLRVPIGGSDFSTHAYAYNDLPENDAFLTNFTLAPEDIMYKIPMIKRIMAVSRTAVHIVATTWSPPPWMKTGRSFAGFSRLKQEYFQTYADYHLKFLQKYNESGIPIWGLTTTNEPINGVFDLCNFNSLGWTVTKMADWIVNNFGPTIRNSSFKDVKIMVGDDQRFTIPYWFIGMVAYRPESLNYVDGVAVHYYTDQFISPIAFEAVTKAHPEKFVLSTEACEGTLPWQKNKVLLGSWQRAKTYVLDILEDLNYNLVGWIDWNLCLDPRGGPNWASNFADAAIIVDKTNDEFIKQPMFYAMGHFSKFIPRGSKRIKVKEHKSIFELSLRHVAFITPRGTIVAVIYNDGRSQTISITIKNRQLKLKLEGDSVSTIEFQTDEVMTNNL
ncbi:lysosomal acid glucosylceramidase-like [Danaus plexippus]|uniref:lysosomal acid glucosylceramidase-like n=1 Tax=Danaus plexippus TaxID=13037 RepID=UPI002AB313E4|nr:lysosomal acid glucosylceramidase-like [Danaus plexippus]